jgi:hypothetical protein
MGLRLGGVIGLALGCALAFVPVQAAEARKGRPSCTQKGRETIVTSSRARVFKRRGKEYGYVWGCLYSVGRSFKLGYYDEEGPDFFSVSPIRLAGVHVGYNAGGETRQGYESDVIVRDLRTGRCVHRWVAPAAGSIGDLRVEDLELKKNGSIGWIASRSRFQGGPIQEVYKSDTRGKATLVDSGEDIDPKSLTLSGSILYWTKAGQAYSASLN